MTSNSKSRSLTRYAWLSIAAALSTITLKSLAYWYTGSIGLYSDAIESLVNLIGGVMALWMLKIAERPADDDHAYGHTKAEYFSSGLEGMLILLAAFSIAWAALLRLWTPMPIEQIGIGLVLSVAASSVNLGAALLPLRTGTRMLNIPFKGVADALPAVANGDVNWTIGGPLPTLPLVRAGRLRAIAITSPQRSKSLPDLPTVAESGVPGFEVVGWFGMFAPAGTPMAIVQQISAEAKRSLQRPEFARRAESEGTEILGGPPAELARVVKAEMDIWREVVKDLGGIQAN